jgi:hypothetical protein
MEHLARQLRLRRGRSSDGGPVNVGDGIGKNGAQRIQVRVAVADMRLREASRLHEP